MVKYLEKPNGIGYWAAWYLRPPDVVGARLPDPPEVAGE
jgi:hypothetical protein